MNSRALKISQFSIFKSSFFCALLTALLLWIPVQKWGLFPLAWFGLAPVLWAARDMDNKARLRYGWRAGSGFYVLTNWWILPTIVYGSPVIGVSPAVGVLLGVIAVSFIAAVHAWQFAIGLWLWDTQKWAKFSWILPIVFALWWGFFDWLRCIPPLAHIWGALAFTQWRDTPILQVASLVGQHGLTILLVWLSTSVGLCLIRRRFIYVAVPILGFVTAHLWGAMQLRQVQRPKRNVDALLVSTNVPSLRKRNFAPGKTSFQAAWHSTQKAMMRETGWHFGKQELIVWPETTIEAWQVGKRVRPVSSQIAEWNALQKRLSRKAFPPAGIYQTQLLTGVTLHRLNGLNEELQNTAWLMKFGQPPQSAPKIRTVPMGERAPLGEYLPFLKRFAPHPEVTPGTKARTLDLNGTPVGTVICFESCFPNPARELKEQGAKVLFIITNDEWFKGTNAPWEHATMAILRAAENQIPVAQVANGGYTLLIDSRGRLLHQSFGAGATPINIPLY